MIECGCTLRERLVGDGCLICNPDLARELAEQNDDQTDDGGDIHANQHQT